MTPRVKATLAVGVGTVVVCVLVALYVFYWAEKPNAVPASSRGGVASITMQTVGALGPRYNHPDWVSYLVQDAHGRWIHSTELRAPAHSLVRVTIHQYDTQTGLRNNFFGKIQGTTGSVVSVDGKRISTLDPGLAAHTFAIPQLGVFVPLEGVAADAPNQCAAAPCTLAHAHHTITFTFRTGEKGRYRFQCFVPCAAGYYAGNGGPMQAYGYMAGYLDVV